MSRRLIVALVLGLVACKPQPTQQSAPATYYVSPSGSDANACTSAQGTVPSGAKLTVAGGVACAHAGDTVYLRGGVYASGNDVIDSQTHPVASGTAASRIHIAGYPGEHVTLRPLYNMSAVRLSTGAPSYLTFQDFTIDMVNSGQGASAEGIYVAGSTSVWFERVEVKNGAGFGVHPADANDFRFLDGSVHDVGLPGAPSTEGHGFYMTANHGIYRGNDIYNNGGYGFHLYNNAGPHTTPSGNVIEENQIHGNGRNGPPGYGIVVAWGADNIVRNNILFGNQGGISIYTESVGTLVYNNTVTSNKAEGISAQYYSSGEAKNNIAYGNGTNLIDYGSNLGTKALIASNNFTADPKFTNAAASDYTLQAGSPALDVGVNLEAVVPTDYVGNPRPQGHTFDDGAYERVTGSTPVPPQPCAGCCCPPAH